MSGADFRRHGGGSSKHYLDDIAPPDVKFGKDHPLAQQSSSSKNG